MASKTFPRRRLGKNGPLVSAMGFGLMVLSGAYGDAPSEEEQFKVLDRAVELGETFWDTAEYGFRGSSAKENTHTWQYLLQQSRDPGQMVQTHWEAR